MKPIEKRTEFVMIRISPSERKRWETWNTKAALPEFIRDSVERRIETLQRNKYPKKSGGRT